MLNLIILILIIVGLIIHRYSTTFWEQKMLPYSMGFLTFANIFTVIYLINFVWIFGFIVGITIFLLTFFQIIYSSFLWPFLLPQLIGINKKLTIPKVNPLVYGSWSYVVIGLGLFTIVNFFVSDYASLTKNIVDFFGGNYLTLALWLAGIVIATNLIRSYILSKYLQEDGHKSQSSKESEVKEAFEILDEASNKFGSAFDSVREEIEKILHSDTKQFLDVVRKGRAVRKFIYSTIANISGDMVESGQHHIYRGVLNSMGPGEKLLKIFDMAMDELVELGDQDEKQAKEQKEAIRKNLKSVG